MQSSSPTGIQHNRHQSLYIQTQHNATDMKATFDIEKMAGTKTDVMINPNFLVIQINV
jgi:hypothetical protein